MLFIYYLLIKLESGTQPNKQGKNIIETFVYNWFVVYQFILHIRIYTFFLKVARNANDELATKSQVLCFFLISWSELLFSFEYLLDQASPEGRVLITGTRVFDQRNKLKSDMATETVAGDDHFFPHTAHFGSLMYTMQQL